jgi:hypothetical protein
MTHQHHDRNHEKHQHVINNMTAAMSNFKPVINTMRTVNIREIA